MHMVQVLVLSATFIVLIVIIGVSVTIGRRLGAVEVKKHIQHKLEVIGVAESAVFGLLALLIAFTFSGSYERYEYRRMHIIEEANTFARAYSYIDIIQPKYQTELRSNIRKYLDLHLTAYSHMPFQMEQVDKDLKQSSEIRKTIWHTLVTACEENPNKTLSQIVIPAVANMFEEADVGVILSEVHMPKTIFLLLIGLASLGAFLVGYNSSENTQKYPIHVASYVLLTAITIFVILNIEFPRAGFLGLKTVDQMLIDVRTDMN